MAMMAMTQPAGPRLREAQHTCQTHCICLALSDPRLQDATGGDLPKVACVSDRNRRRSRPTVVDGEGLCLHQRINTQAGGAYALISRPPFFL